MLSFLVTTPETCVRRSVTPLSASRSSAAAGLVIKDVIMMGAALVTMADLARAYLTRLDGGVPERRDVIAHSKNPTG